MTFKLVLISALVATALAYPRGAPEEACATLLPEHRAPAQDVVPEHSLVVTKSEFADKTFNIKIGAGGNFLGFLIVARDSNDQTVDGSWSALDNTSKALTCGLTHTSNEAKTEVSGQWTAPAGFSGQITFKAAVVVEYAVFWNNLASEAFNL